MDLGMLGAIGGAGKGLADVGQANNQREMELFKMQAEEDMRNRTEERRMAMAGRVQEQQRAARASAVQDLNQKVATQNNQNDANVINVNNPGSNVSAADLATANAGNPLNASQRAAYGLTEADPVAVARQRAELALESGDPTLQAGYESQFKNEIANKNVDMKAELQDLKTRVEKGQGLTANNRDWQSWKEGEKLKGKTDKETTFGDYMKFVKQMDLGNYKAYTASQRGIVLNPDAEKPAGMQDGAPEEVVDYSTFFKK